MVMCNSGAESRHKPDVTYAVLFMSYGGPDSLDDIEPYLLDIRGGRPTAPELVNEIRERYAQIGGKSPLLEITCSQAEATEALLKEIDPANSYRLYVGMRHWTPYIRDAVSELINDRVKDVITLCMTPYYSQATVGAYQEKFQEAYESLGATFKFTHIDHWHNHPRYIQAVAEKVRGGLEKFPADVRDQVQIVFTAHSLPASLIEQGDPYDAHLKETSNLVIEELGKGETPVSMEGRWQFCYQSAGARKVVWLGPSIEETIGKIAEAGHKYLLVAPIGFLCDHVEILYDIDIECKELAESKNMHLERTDSQNASPTFVRALAEIVTQTAAKQQ